MSVINKMLKDLEQRQDPEVPLGTTGATYQPKPANKPSTLLLVLIAVIIVLISALAWLWFSQPASTTNLPKLVSDEPTTVIETENKTASNTTKNQADNVTELKQPSVSLALPKPQVAAEQTQTKSSEVPSETVKPAKTETTKPVTQQVVNANPIDKTQVNNAAPAVADNTANESPSPTRVNQVDDTKAFAAIDSKLKIEKSSTSLTPEQRVENLMKKAKNSFDKGYITEAISQLEEVLSSADGHIEARNLLAVAWYGRGELQTAVNILNNGLNRYPSVELWRLTAAKIYFKENQIQGAFSYLEANLSNASIEYYSMKGTLGRQLKVFDKAESAYVKLTELEPENASWWLGYAIVLDSQSKFDLARESYKTALTKSGLSNASINFASQRIEELQE